MFKFIIRIFLIVLGFSIGLFSIIPDLQAVSPEEVVSKYHEAKKDLRSYKLLKKDFIKQTVVRLAGIKFDRREPNISEMRLEEEGIVDIENKKIFFIVKQVAIFPEFPEMSNMQGLSDTYEEYAVDNFGYSEHKFYDGENLKEKKWYKSISLANKMWEEADIFYIYKGLKGLENIGLKLKELTEEKVDGEDCYRISYVIDDSEKFKKFSSPEGGVIFTKEFTGIENCPWNIKFFLLEAYLSKRTYFPVACNLKLNVAILYEESPEIDFQEIIYDIQLTSKISDCNKSVNIQLAEEAKKAEEVK